MRLSTQVYKWVSANLMLGVTLQWTSVPSGGSRNISSLNTTETGDKHKPTHLLVSLYKRNVLHALSCVIFTHIGHLSWH